MSKKQKAKSAIQVLSADEIQQFERDPKRTNYAPILALKPGEGCFIPGRGYHHVYASLYRRGVSRQYKVWEGISNGIKGTFVKNIESQ